MRLTEEERRHDFLKVRFAAAFAFKSSLELPFRFGFVPKGSFLTVLINDSSRRCSAQLDSDEHEVWVMQTDTAWAQERLIMAQRDEVRAWHARGTWTEGHRPNCTACELFATRQLTHTGRARR